MSHTAQNQMWAEQLPKSNDNPVRMQWAAQPTVDLTPPSAVTGNLLNFHSFLSNQRSRLGFAGDAATLPPLDLPKPKAHTMKLLGHGFYWQDLKVGDAFYTYGRTVAEADITAFCNVVGFVEPLFTDAEYRRTHSAMAGFAAPAALVYAVAEGLSLAGTAHGTGLAFLHADVDVKGPVVGGDTLHVQIEITEARATSKGRGLVRSRNLVVNQHGKTVLIYTPLRLMAGRPDTSVSV
jgi:acyl dehydratase